MRGALLIAAMTLVLAVVVAAVLPAQPGRAQPLEDLQVIGQPATSRPVPLDVADLPVPAGSQSTEEPPAEDPEDLLAGFDDSFAINVEPAPEPESRLLDLKGFARLASAYGVDHERPVPGQPDWRGLSRLRLDLQLELDARLGSWKAFVSGRAFRDLVFSLRSGSSYPDPVVDEYESELELREAFIRGEPASGLTLTLGRQIVAWGRSDTFRVGDLLNPLDLREPGLVDIEDLRLPVTMARADIELGQLVLGLVAIPEVRLDKSPVPGHDLYPGSGPLPVGARLPNDLSHSELGLSLDIVRSGWDLSVYASSVYADTPSLIIQDEAKPRLEHRRLDTLALAAGCARGNAVLFVEAAVVDGVRLLSAPGRLFTRSDLLLGVEHSGLNETVVTLEILNRHLHDLPSGSLMGPERPRRNQVQTALRITRDLLHDRLQLMLLSVHDGLAAEHGSWQRLTARLELAPGLSATLGAVVFNGGDGWLEHLEPADRALFELRYDF
jgi:hypothetical protein